MQSRKGRFSLEGAAGKLRSLCHVLKKYPKKVFAFTVLMRQARSAFTPKQQAQAELIKQASMAASNKKKQAEFLKKLFPKTWPAYLAVRKRNLAINKKAIQMARGGFIDFLAVSMDDFSHSGLNHSEREELERAKASSDAAVQGSEDALKSDSVEILPGTDEMGMLLLCRLLLMHYQLSPKIAVFFSHSHPDQYPLRYEGITLTKLLKTQLTLLGCELPQTASKPDLLLFIHPPQEPQQDVPLTSEPKFSYSWLKRLQSSLIRDGNCILADLRFANGGDAGLLRTLSPLAPLSRLLSYSGWNTTANALGMALAHGIIRWVAKEVGEEDEKAHQQFLCLRFLEDWLYQAEIRPVLSKRFRDKGKPLFHLNAADSNKLEKEVKTEMNQLSRTYLMKHFSGLEVNRIKFPWNRLFDIEIGFKISS